jgi:opacity protein-like surface antigen
MRKLLFGLAVALFATTASAQAKPFLGVGAKVGGSAVVPMDPALGQVARVGGGQMVLAVPMNLTPMLRLEPYLGWSRYTTVDSSGVDDFRVSAQQTALGAALHVMNDMGGNVNFYYGGRIGVVLSTYSWDDGTNDDSNTYMGFNLAALAGAEYFFSPKFALGVEGEISYVNAEVGEDFKENTFGTSTFLSARVFF